MEFLTIPCNPKNYGGIRTQKVEYIVIHYTANDGDLDSNNGLYFKNNVVGASAHWFVDSESATLSVPENRIAWHCGANSYKHPRCRNGNSIGIEICDDLRNGVIYPSAKTIANAIELTKQKMKEYNVPAENVIRHYDVTGKKCPAYWVEDAKWRSEFWNKLPGATDSVPVTPEKQPETAAPEELYRVQTGAFSQKKYADAKVKAVKAAGFDAFCVLVSGWWKVQVGAFQSRQGAENFAKEVQAAGFSCFVTKNSVAKTDLKPIAEIAKEVIQGKWGNGLDRIKRLTEAGYDPDAVQNKVNELF